MGTESPEELEPRAGGLGKKGQSGWWVMAAVPERPDQTYHFSSSTASIKKEPCGGDRQVGRAGGLLLSKANTLALCCLVFIWSGFGWIDGD